jgi:hypothetical protein
MQPMSDCPSLAEHAYADPDQAFSPGRGTRSGHPWVGSQEGGLMWL